MTTTQIAAATSRDGNLKIVITREGGDEATDGEFWLDVTATDLAGDALSRTFWVEDAHTEQAARDFANFLWATTAPEFDVLLMQRDAAAEAMA